MLSGWPGQEGAAGYMFVNVGRQILGFQLKNVSFSKELVRMDNEVVCSQSRLGQMRHFLLLISIFQHRVPVVPDAYESLSIALKPLTLLEYLHTVSYLCSTFHWYRLTCIPETGPRTSTGTE